MPKIIFVAADGTRQEVNEPAGYSLMEAAVLNGVPAIIGLCGGLCSCATCHCYPETRPDLPPILDGEEAMLERAYDRRPESRLGCQVHLTDAMDGMVVHLPSHQADEEG
jgi:2Fe-2S ferredoxin